MSQNEVESFKITGYDLDNKFNIARRKLSKKQQMLDGTRGMWADELSARPSFKTFKDPKNYTARVNFVAGGIQQALFVEKPKEKENKDDEEDPQTKHSSSNSEDERSKSRSSFLNLDSDIADLRIKCNQVNPLLMKSGMGSWEAHTKGIGAKLLLQMGFEPGKGLGKQLQGISAPVEAYLRKGRGAIGAYGPEKDMMNRASNPQNHQPGVLKQVSYLTSLKRTRPTISQMAPITQPRMETRRGLRTASRIPQGFKDFKDSYKKKGEVKSILMPTPDKFLSKEAKQVYKGQCSARLTSNV